MTSAIVFGWVGRWMGASPLSPLAATIFFGTVGLRTMCPALATGGRRAEIGGTVRDVMVVGRFSGV